MTRRLFLGGNLAMALNRDRIDEAGKLVRKATDSGDVSAAALSVCQGKSFRVQQGFGKAPAPDAVFLLASITKPMTAIAVMILSDRKQLAITEPVSKFIPEFRGGDRSLITIQHLLTHTSGLPDMLPENEALRRRHAPLKDFVAGTCKVPLLFRPGSEVRYQSMGTLLAAETVERVTKSPLRDFLHRELFQPLKMSQTALGLGTHTIPETMQCQVPNPDDDWNWNTPYWRNLGAPWGGAHSSVLDLDRLLEYFLQPDGRVLQPETAKSMLTDHTSGMKESFGLGWMRQHPARFGKSCSPTTFGHYGSTGTVAWADPKTGVRCILLTTKPAAQSRDGLLGPVSDLVATAAS